MPKKGTRDALASVAISIAALFAFMLAQGCGDAMLEGAAGGPGSGGEFGTGTGANGGTNGVGGNGGSVGTGGIPATGGTGGVPDRPTSNTNPCTDGVDCLCDLLADDSTILFCEDFEHPNLPQRSNSVPGRTEWHEQYGPGVEGCTHNPAPGTNVGFVRMGRDSNDCIDIYEEGGPNDCEGGDTDCVFGGGHSLGFRHRPGINGGTNGRARFGERVRDFGYTIALRYSPNYLAPGDPGLSGPQVAEKFDEFGDNKHALMGASNSNAGRNHPWSGTVLTTNPAPEYDTTLGSTHITSTGKYKMSPATSEYQWKRDFDVAQWGCFQMQVDNWGLSNMRLRYWFNGTLVYDGTLDATNLQQGRDQNGIDSFVWNSYRNDGYGGPDIAVRYEDNVVVANGAPVSCAVIGFEEVGN